MTQSIFFRVLQAPIIEKAEGLKSQVASVNDQTADPFVFFRQAEQFEDIPGSPFAYWATNKLFSIFRQFPSLESEGRTARFGLSTKDDFRFLRVFWEAKPDSINKTWFPLAKGGTYAPYFYDHHLVLDWEDNGKRLKEFAVERSRQIFGSGSWSRWINNWDYYFRPGLTWPRRTNGFSVRALPKGCVFADKGPAVFSSLDSQNDLLALLAIMNSAAFLSLIQVQLARTELAQSYEVGIIQTTPIPLIDEAATSRLAKLSLSALVLARTRVLSDETTHVFQLPVAFQPDATKLSLSKTIDLLSRHETDRQKNLASIQGEIDSFVASLYGVPKLVESAISMAENSEGEEFEEVNDDDEEGPNEEISLNPKRLVSDLLMWCVGATFGRWDVRVAHDPSRLAPLPGPFDPLPVCSPGMLVGEDGLPLTSPDSISDYPLPIAWDGVLVDDPGHPRDLVAAVRQVLKLLYQDHAEAIEQEACEILGVSDLRTYFRDPKQFFHFHIKRYSKSRRKAPIYWLLQSKKRNYAVWLYYPRLNPDLLFHAGREYVDAKLKLETTRLEELQANLSLYSGTSLKVKEKQIAQQKDLVSELKAFQKELDRVALLQLKPDLNDGVLLNIAPLCDLIPWKEPAKAWRELLSGKYEWSSIGGQLCSRGLVSQ